MDSEDMEMDNNEESSNHEDTTTWTGEQEEIPHSGNTDTYADIHPLVAKTKGRKNNNAAHKNGKSKPPILARPEPQLDENGKPKGMTLCGTCNKIDGHNSRTCKNWQLAKQLMETH
jgi:hypothetical protein